MDGFNPIPERENDWSCNGHHLKLFWRSMPNSGSWLYLPPDALERAKSALPCHACAGFIWSNDTFEIEAREALRRLFLLVVSGEEQVGAAWVLEGGDIPTAGKPDKGEATDA